MLNRSEVARVLDMLNGLPRLVAMILYGSGMRLLECLTLRIKDVDIERGEIRIRRGTGAKARVTICLRSVESRVRLQNEFVALATAYRAAHPLLAEERHDPTSRSND